MDAKRDKFIKDEIKNLRKHENNYVNVSKLNPNNKSKCKEIFDLYCSTCDKSEVLRNIRHFYNNDFYKKYSQIVDKLDSFKKLYKAMEEYSHFKTLFKITSQLEDNEQLEIENNIITCIKKRIEYKYTCLSDDEKKDFKKQYNHDARILYHIFYENKLKELKSLLIKLNKQYIKVKERIIAERKEEDRVRAEEDKYDLAISKLALSDSSSSEITSDDLKQDTWTTVISKKNKKSSKKKYHK